MTDFYSLFPFLPGARRLLPEGLSLDLIPEQLLLSASSRLKMMLSRHPSYRSILSPREEVFHYVVMRLLVSLLGSDYYYDRFARFYAERVRVHTDLLDDFFAELGYDPSAVPLSEYMKYKHIYPETKIYHLPLRAGIVHLPRRVQPYFAATVAYTIVRSSLPADVSSVPERFKEFATAAVPVAAVQRSSRGWGFIERIFSASGIPDGKKRIILYWLMPYLISVRGLPVDEAVARVTEWLARQGGQKVPRSWVRSDAENVKRHGIRPWGLKKVEQQDPSLVKMLRSLGVLD